MNKLLWKQHLEIKKNGEYQLESSENVPTQITIAPNVCCKLSIFGSCPKEKVEVHVEEASNVLLQAFFQDGKLEMEIFLEGYQAQCKVATSMVATIASSIKIAIHHLASKTKSFVYPAIVNYGKEFVSIRVDASVPKGKIGCHLEQDNQIILIDEGSGKILPNLWIDEFDCFAEHGAYISKFAKEKLFYLQMRGIPLETCYYLLAKSILLGKMELTEEEQTRFIEIIQNMREVKE